MSNDLVPAGTPAEPIPTPNPVPGVELPAEIIQHNRSLDELMALDPFAYTEKDISEICGFYRDYREKFLNEEAIKANSPTKGRKKAEPAPKLNLGNLDLTGLGLEAPKPASDLNLDDLGL